MFFEKLAKPKKRIKKGYNEIEDHESIVLRLHKVSVFGGFGEQIKRIQNAYNKIDDHESILPSYGKCSSGD